MIGDAIDFLSFAGIGGNATGSSSVSLRKCVFKEIGYVTLSFS
jgi:hypothetical protein